MPAAEGSAGDDRRRSECESTSPTNGLYVKHDLYPKSSSVHSSDRDDDEMDHQPLLKLARYAVSPNSILPFHQQHPNFFEANQTSSPLPRRKQARPRRRSGDSTSSSNTSPLSLVPEPHFKLLMSTPSPVQDMPEDLSIKKSPVERQTSDESGSNSDRDARSETPQSVASAKAESTSSESAKNDFGERKNVRSPGSNIPSLLSSIIMNSQPIPASNNLLTLSPIHQQDRRKGQHSAPRGGPPRAWTNGDLTEALNQVWNRKMTTSQASRVFGIPYNSLLMYVRGKYGKSLKLDTLRKETLEGEAMALAASTRGSYKLAALSAAAAAAAASGSSGTAAPPAPPAKSSKSSKSNSANNSAANSTAAPAPAATSTPPISAKTIVNNNNNETVNKNNNNNNEIKASQKNPPMPAQKNTPLLTPGQLNLSAFPPHHHLNEMDALSVAQSLAAAGLGGFGAVNPYLSYFCDFSFPMPLALGGLLPPAASAPGARLLRPGEGLLKKAADMRAADESAAKKAKKLAKSLPTNHSDVEIDSKDGDSDVDDKVERAKKALPLMHGRPLIPASLDLSQTGQV